jgi:hypothetical protein
MSYAPLRFESLIYSYILSEFISQVLDAGTSPSSLSSGTAYRIAQEQRQGRVASDLLAELSYKESISRDNTGSTFSPETNTGLGP